MQYQKPELVALPSALEAVRMQDKYDSSPLDSTNIRRFTVNAYEADE